jgi:hypothetical protein
LTAILDSVKAETGNMLNIMISKLIDEDKQELIEKISSFADWTQNSEVFKFLGLSE